MVLSSVLSHHRRPHVLSASRGGGTLTAGLPPAFCLPSPCGTFLNFACKFLGHSPQPVPTDRCSAPPVGVCALPACAASVRALRFLRNPNHGEFVLPFRSFPPSSPCGSGTQGDCLWGSCG